MWFTNAHFFRNIHFKLHVHVCVFAVGHLCLYHNCHAGGSIAHLDRIALALSFWRSNLLLRVVVLLPFHLQSCLILHPLICFCLDVILSISYLKYHLFCQYFFISLKNGKSFSVASCWVCGVCSMFSSCTNIDSLSNHRILVTAYFVTFAVSTSRTHQ